MKQWSKLKVSKAIKINKLNYVPQRNIAISFDITTIHKHYANGSLKPSEVVKKSHNRIAKDTASWIFKVPSDHVVAEAEKQDQELANIPFDRILEKYPLFGIPFGVKDNIDVAGFPTTAACPAFSRTPWVTNPVVDQLKQAGAILMGKQNMDQFAAGLVGVRSPYGTPVNPFNPKYCPGGSSSGSGVSTSTHQVAFSLGTDTAGSGRVPACFNNIVGLKPTPRVLSTRAMVPACRTLDCVSIFALTADDAWKVFNLCNAYDHLDEYARTPQNAPFHSADKPLHFGYPKGEGLKFFGDTRGMYEAYADARRLLSETTGAIFVPIDFTPFTEVARILYDGPWISERLSALQDFYNSNKDDIHPVTRGLLTKGHQYSAVQTFLGMRRLEKLRREAHEIWDEAGLDALIVPTASVTPTIHEVLEVPVGLNTVLGLYTNFVNLLDLCAMAVPNTFLPSGMPTGITIIGKAFDDHFVYQVGRFFQSQRNLSLGATEHKLPEKSQNIAKIELLHEYIDLAVCGAHMKDLPLNKQLLQLGGSLVKALKTTPEYNLYDISSPDLKRPGMVRAAKGKGSAIEVEVWRIPRLRASDFLEKVKAPLTLGTVELEDGTSVKGFLCESYITSPENDITSFGGWRSYIKSKTF
jgi:allophanate hydrolase